MAKTLFDKIWDSHVITALGNGFVLLHIDRLLLHDLSGARPCAMWSTRAARPPSRAGIYATPDHAILDHAEAAPRRRFRPAHRC